jgi:proton-translocating NADH-quinone oxidoreductase chain L
MTVPLLLTIATLLPLASFGVLAGVGRRMGSPIAGIVGTLFVAGSFVCSLAAMIVWLSLDVAGGRAAGFGGQPIRLDWNWLPAGGGRWLQLGLYVDSLTIVMFSMVTIVAALAHVFSMGYMADDRRFARFYTYLSLSCFSMLALVLGGTLLQVLVFWELAGVCSYLLIGFWYEKRTATNAATKAFVVHRVGDAGFLVGLGLLFLTLGNVSLPDVWGALGGAGQLQAGQAIVLPTAGAPPAGTVVSTAEAARLSHVPAGTLTLIGVALFFGAAARSAQFPLHTWLPDAMEGPTPANALVHAATMAAAGVYLVARTFPILTPDAKLYVALTGLVTLTFGALVALAQTDIKRVLAYATLSQLGYMMLALGVGSWVGALFHVVTHGFFMTLLFLGAGAVIRAAHHEQEMTEFGGLWRRIPYTAITFAVGVVALAGVGFTLLGYHVGFAGSFSKDVILQNAGAFAALAERGGRGWAYALFFWIPTAVAGLTAFAMTRCWMMTFAGGPRNPGIYRRARELPVMYIPLIVLGVLSMIGGTSLMGVRTMLESAVRETGNAFDPRLLPAGTPAAADGRFAGFSTAWQGRNAYAPPEGGPPPAGREAAVAQAYEEGERLVRYVPLTVVVGMVLGVAVYWRGLAVPRALLRFPPLRWAHVWLYRAMYLDELYTGVVVVLTLALATVVAWADGLIAVAIDAATWPARKAARLVRVRRAGR